MSKFSKALAIAFAVTAALAMIFTEANKYIGEVIKFLGGQ